MHARERCQGHSAALNIAGIASPIAGDSVPQDSLTLARSGSIGDFSYLAGQSVPVCLDRRPMSVIIEPFNQCRLNGPNCIGETAECCNLQQCVDFGATVTTVCFDSRRCFHRPTSKQLATTSTKADLVRHVRCIW